MRHAYIETTAQDPTDERIQGNEWNADHVMPALSADPDDPSVGQAVMWMSDGTGLGDAGDIMTKINVGGTIKYCTICDFSNASTISAGITDESGTIITDEGGTPITDEGGN